MKKIALVVDVENWAFYNIAKNIKKNIGNQFIFDIIPMANIDDNIVKFWLISKDYDLIHFFWRGHVSYINNWSFKEYIEKLGGNPDEFNKTFIKDKIITTSVYDHLFLDENGMDLTSQILGNVNDYTVSSNILYEIYNELPIIMKPSAIISDGVDLSTFYPINIERFKNIKDRTIKIGWVGNSKWHSSDIDYKGLHTIIKPAIKNLKEQGYDVEIFFADKQETMIPHDEMVYYYSQIDLYICASLIEGTPNPVLESMACGIPIISTNVGIVSEALGPKQKKMILKNRTQKDLEEKIKHMLDNYNLFEELSKENLAKIKNWTWENKSKQYEDFFKKNLEQQNN